MTPVKLNYTTTSTFIHDTFAQGIKTQAEVQNARTLFGPCQIDVPYKGVLGIIADEIISPFYVFQVKECVGDGR